MQFEKRRSAALPLAMLVLFAALAIVHTWPLASAPGTLSRNDTSDTLLHEWTISWVAHQIVRDPLHLFDANIFYPERYTLAYSDHLIVQSLMVAPLLWAGASPVLAYNMLLIAGLALTGWTTSLVVHRWTGSWLAGALSGSLMAFNAFTLTRLPQIQDQHLEFFPLALLALDRLLTEPRVRHGLHLAGWYILQALACGYLLVFAFLSLVVAAVVRPEEWFGRRLRAFASPVLVMAAVTILTLTPFMIPYLIVSRDQGLMRSLPEVTQYSAQVADYLSTGGRLHYALWSHQFFYGQGLFPGLVGFGLATIAVLSGVGVSDRRARMALGFGIFAFAFSFGPGFPLYGLLYRAFPLMQGIRGAARFGQFFLAAVAILAAFGLVALQQRVRRGALALSVALLIAANVEALRAPLGYFAYGGIPPIYDNLRDTGRRAVVVFFPFYGDRAFGNARYLLPSTRFWKPMLNGYSGFSPRSLGRHAERLRGFPDRGSVDYLRSSGVTHVVVDVDRLSPGRVANLAGFPELRLWQTDSHVRIYVLE